VPDITAEVLRTAEERDAIWSEWEMRGTRVDGTAHLMRGVVIFGVTGNRASWARFYLEAVDAGEGGVDAAVDKIVRSTATAMTTGVRDARPPDTVVRVLNPVLRIALRTPLGRLIRPFALLEFNGRRSGRRYRVPVGWHENDRGALVITPAPWRSNFADTTPVTVYFKGKPHRMIGTLTTNSETVADALQSLFDHGTSPRLIGLDLPKGHRITASDVSSVGRAAIQFRRCDSGDIN
jgi:hypothetical protein